MVPDGEEREGPVSNQTSERWAEKAYRKHVEKCDLPGPVSYVGYSVECKQHKLPNVSLRKTRQPLD